MVQLRIISSEALTNSDAKINETDVITQNIVRLLIYGNLKKLNEVRLKSEESN